MPAVHQQDQLCRVVQQGAQVAHGVCGVPVHAGQLVQMVAGKMVQANGLRDVTRPHCAHQICRLLALQNLGKLRPDALARHATQALCIGLDGLQGVLAVDGFLRHAAVEAKVAQNPQVIFLDPFVGVAHKHHALLLDVLAAVEIVVQAAVQVHAHGVDGQVAPLSIQQPRVCELHICVPSSGIHVDAQCGDFVGDMVNGRHHSAVLQPRGNVADAFRLENVQNLVWGGGTGKVNVLGLAAHDDVAHCPSHQPQLPAMPLENLSQPLDGRRIEDLFLHLSRQGGRSHGPSEKMAHLLYAVKRSFHVRSSARL
eukprot:m.136639 g.136639  ORF g.136639 m.136639 type:complete len:311 (-) comp20200_c1_seq3:34-966(-)